MDVSGKGKGIFANAPFDVGSFLCEYTGELIKAKEGCKREKLYAAKELGSFLLFFHYNGEKLW